MRLSIRFAAALLIAFIQSACWISHTEFDRPLTREQLAGTWVSDWTNKSHVEPAQPDIYKAATETLQLNTDGTYRHSFESGSNYNYRGPTRTWSIELRRKHLFVVLHRMRDYSRGIAHAEAERSEDVRLIVEGDRGDLLCFEDDDLNVCFKRR